MSSPVFRRLFLLLLVTLSASSAAGDDSLTAYQILQQYDFPPGLLPEGVTGYELDKSSGKFEAYLGGGSTCSFKVEDYELKYKSTITGVISKGKIKNLKGISVKVLFLWFNIGEVTRDGDDLQFSVGIASANFGVENFVECPQCGCGFDCVNGGKRECVKLRLKFNSFVSSLLRYKKSMDMSSSNSGGGGDYMKYKSRDCNCRTKARVQAIEGKEIFVKMLIVTSLVFSFFSLLAAFLALIV